MAMKKKFLGLALAAAVALPATTAYANTITVTGNDTDTLTQDVTVSGTVRKSNGEAPAGRLEVELPTAMAFTVDEEGNFNKANYKVTNRSAVGIRLSVAEFRETDPNGGITLNRVSGFDPADKDRANIAMSLNGNVDGSFTSVDLSQVTAGTEQNVLDVGAKDAGILSLSGVAGIKKDNPDLESNGAKEDFTLVFKVKKKI